MTSKVQQLNIHSMTAFARVQDEGAHGNYAWELRSVNHRYLETQFKLPESLRPLEPVLREKIRSRLARGKVDTHLHFQASTRDVELGVNADKVIALKKAALHIANLAGLECTLTTQQLMQWPGVLEQAELDYDAVAADLLLGFDRALDALQLAREGEGSKLAQMLRQRIDQIDVLVARVRQRMPEVLDEHRRRIETRLAELKVDLDSDRLTQEVVLLAQKVDVAEELDRLCAHVEEVRATLGKPEPCGRRLDFLMQELNREANTLGSKSIVVDVSQAAVELKVLIEQMREQVQNIE